MATKRATNVKKPIISKVTGLPVDPKRSRAAKKAAATRRANLEAATATSNLKLHHKIIAGGLIAVVILFAGLGIKNVLTAYAATAQSVTFSGLGGKCLDDRYSGAYNRNWVWLYQCNGTNAQKWILDGGAIKSSIGNQSFCLDDPGSSTMVGIRIWIYQCNGTRAQQWTIKNGTLVNAVAGYCVGTQNNSTANGTRLTLKPCSSDSGQTWTTKGGSTVSVAPPANGTPVTTGGGTSSVPTGTTSTSSFTNGDGSTTVFKNGVVDPTLFKNMANSMATTTGITYRFGQASTDSTSGRPSWSQPQNHSYQGDNTTHIYQYGNVNTSLNDFSNNQGQVGYISNNRETFGMDSIATLQMNNNVYGEQPELAWQLYGGHPSGEIKNGKSSSCGAGNLVDQARANGHGEAMASSFGVFDNGVIAEAGTNTAGGRGCIKLPSNLHPTSISITDENEYALVTVMNTDTNSSELAVIALGGSQTGGFWDYEWTQLYPGFRNYGFPEFLKFLGTVPLPMVAATGVSAVSDYPAGDWLHNPGGGNVNPASLPLNNESNRQTFINGQNQNFYGKAGYAVVFSREEHKVSFVDLQPLFDNISAKYFGSQSTFNSVVNNVGQGANQWPFAFSSAPVERPTVVKTITMTQTPSAVAGMLSGAKTPRAYVATVDGQLHVFEVGGLATTAAANPNDIREAGAITVGKNPTNITYSKDHPNNTSLVESQIIVTNRGSRSIQWVNLNGDGGSIDKTLTDSRLVDPIATVDNNNHGTESYLIDVADYGAGKVMAYRYGSIIFHTNGGATYGALANGVFEFGGSYDPNGKPFTISTTNVT